MNYPYDELPLNFVDALGIQTGYYTAGQPDHQPVLLLHGMSTSADSFRETMHHLADTYWLIAPDIPGFGHSQNTEPYSIAHLVEWLASFKTALSLPNLALLGHSFGGLLASSFAAWYPEDVTRLLLLAPAILTSQNYPTLLKRVGTSLGLIEMGTAISQSRLMVRRQIRVPFHDPNRQHNSVWERRLADYDRARASASVMKATAFFDLSPHLAQIRQPTCLVWGKNDPVLPHTDGDKLLQRMANAELHKLDECGHLPMVEQMEAFVTIADRFLAASKP